MNPLHQPRRLLLALGAALEAAQALGDRVFDRLLDQRVEERMPCSLIICDIDHFKRVNDNYGHNAGDLILTRLARLLQSQVRESDIACRIGGEEFALIMPEVPLKIAAQRAERLRTEIGRAHV